MNEKTHVEFNLKADTKLCAAVCKSLLPCGM
jgi:hypothetical protein